ncbi:SAM-dependent methyltransferase [Haloplanus halophilus]|uniref:SAM-dependent methyltransferase n=1 Tax=Haloplanus halophilus TaxID=2949993 RepID=UPI0020418F27|nr:TrmO family methyltransferase [Haloplanus sp. GDY1]
MECDPIGTAHTPFETTSEAPRQGFHEDAAGVVELVPAAREGLTGFDADRVVVVWWADRADRSVLTLARDPERGVFTSRSPARPNPVCISECRVDAVDAEAGRLDLRGVDMADGSPVIDLKATVDVQCWTDDST